MADELLIDTEAGKEQKYQELLPQIEALISGETDVVANLANTTSALKQAMDYFWVGFYIVKNDELVLGPFQGPIACTRIKKGKGVCGTSWADGKTIVVDNVDEFPGHIACSSASKSEIVLPVFNNAKVVAILDVDSDELAAFDEVDKKYLKMLMGLLESVFN